MRLAAAIFLGLVACAIAKGPVEFRVHFDEEIQLESDFSNYGVEPYAFEKEINKTINGIISKIPDPLIVPKIAFDKDTPSFRANILIENLNYVGASTIAAKFIQFNLLKSELKLILSIARIDLAFFYDADVLAMFIPLYGKGTTQLKIKDVEIEINAKLALGKPQVLKEFDAALRIADVKFALTGFLNNEELSEIISDAVTETVPEFMAKYGPTLSKKFSKIVQKIVNDNVRPKPKPTSGFETKRHYIPIEGGNFYYEY